MFFRASAQRKAYETGVSGWVRNLPDGSVEVMVSGDSDKVDLFCQWLGEGPKMAVVKDVKLENLEYENIRGFIVK